MTYPQRDTDTEPNHGSPLCSTKCKNCGKSYKAHPDTLDHVVDRYGKVFCGECQDKIGTLSERKEIRDKHLDNA